MSAAKVRDVLVGLMTLALAIALLTVAYLAYHRVLVPSSSVLLRTDVVGNALQVGSDVKLNGVPVGHVERIHATEQGAELSLALDPAVLDQLPEDVTARMLPKTLFGERYVALVVPEERDGGTLRAGGVIHQDASAEAAELQQVLDELLPVMRAIQPEKLAAMLGEFAGMLRGNGEELGDTMVVWQRYLEKLDPLVPRMTEDLERLARVADDWTIAVPDLLDALSTMTTTTQTLVDQQTQLRSVYANVIGSADSAHDWFDDHHDTIVILAEESRAALRATAPYASQFPCLFRAVSNFVPQMETALGKGTDEPGVHAILQVVPARGKYLTSDAELKYTQGKSKPRCPYVTGEVGTSPAPRVTLPGAAPEDDAPETSGAAWPTTEAATTDQADDTGEPPSIAPPPGTSVPAHLRAIVGLGDANSPGENQLIAELVAPTQGMAPGDYPAWNSLLLGPTLRNTKVVVR